MKKAILVQLLYVALFFTLCSSCVRYKVDDRPAAVCGIDTNLSLNFIYSYYDSLAAQYSWNKPPEKWIAFFHIDDDQVKDRVYYLSEGSPEMYYVKFTVPVFIEAVFDGHKYKDWTYGGDVEESEKVRICSRFKREVLDKMSAFGRSNKIPHYLN